MAAVNRILFVCSGNAARSPMAAEILRSLGVTRSRLRHVVVESAGTHASDGERPFDGAIEAMEEIGLSIGGHRARLLTPTGDPERVRARQWSTCAAAARKSLFCALQRACATTRFSRPSSG